MFNSRLSVRAVLALLLAASAALFFFGIYVERSTPGAASPALGAPNHQPEGSPSLEGTGGEVGEAGHSAQPEATNGEAGSEAAGEQSAEARPFGIDLESPLPVGGAIVTSLVLALAVLALATPLVPLAIVGFSGLFAALDLLEVTYQVGASRAGLVVVALALVVIHAAAGFIALRLFLDLRRSPVTAA